jgi:hypothetical protein
MIRRVLSGAAAAGFVVSAVAQIVSLVVAGSSVGSWLLPLFAAVFPLGAAGAVVSLRLWRRGVWSRRQQMRYILERCPSWATTLNYALIALALVRFVPYLRSSGSPGVTRLADLPLGPASAVCLVVYFTLWCLFTGGLEAGGPGEVAR